MSTIEIDHHFGSILSALGIVDRISRMVGGVHPIVMLFAVIGFALIAGILSLKLYRILSKNIHVFFLAPAILLAPALVYFIYGTIRDISIQYYQFQFLASAVIFCLAYAYFFYYVFKDVVNGNLQHGKSLIITLGLISIILWTIIIDIETDFNLFYFMLDLIIDIKNTLVYYLDRFMNAPKAFALLV